MSSIANKIYIGLLNIYFYIYKINRDHIKKFICKMKKIEIERG
jgi:hypothetical protein